MAGSGGVVTDGVEKSLGFVFEGEGSLLIVNVRGVHTLVVKEGGIDGLLAGEGGVGVV